MKQAHRASWNALTWLRMGAAAAAILFGGLSIAQPPAQPTATPLPISASPPVSISPEIQRLLQRYARTFQTEEIPLFETCFWEPGPYSKLFQDLCDECFDMRVDYLRIEPQPQPDPNQARLRVKVQYYLRENRTKKPVRQVSLIELQLEQRSGQWKFLSIRSSARKSDKKQ